MRTALFLWAVGVQGSSRSLVLRSLPLHHETPRSFLIFPTSSAQRPPEQVVAEANEEVLKLEAAVRALGGESSVHAKLVEALKAARAKSRVLPVTERLVACRNFLERARKRVARAEELNVKATEQKSAFVLEVQEAEDRLQQ